MLKLSKIASYAALIFIVFTSQIASAAISAADRAFLGITPSVFTIGGTVTGLNASSLLLRNNGSDELTIQYNGAFEFHMPVAAGSDYKVTLVMQPMGQICKVNNGSGTATGNVTNIQVVCENNTPPVYTIGGTVEGSNGGRLVLLNNNTDQLVVNNGLFQFSNRMVSGSTYRVNIFIQPPGQACMIQNGQGIVNQDVTNVRVLCQSQ
jgi:hypothetical protein